MKRVKIDLREMMHMRHVGTIRKAIVSTLPRSHWVRLDRTWVSPMWVDGHIHTPILRFINQDI